MWTLRDTLSSIRVLEDASGTAAPYLGRLMADLGADVVKIEPLDGDPLRRSSADHDGFSGAFEHTNAGKRSIAIDRTSTAGRDLLTRFRRLADVVILDQTTALGIGEWLVQDLKPTAIVAAVTPFGLKGPRSGYRAGPRTLFHEGGMLVDVRSDTRPLAPPSPAGQFANFEGGVLAAVGVLGAIVAKRSAALPATTSPIILDVSVQDAVVHSCRQDLMMFPNEGVDVAPRRGRVVGPFGAVVVQCVDGEVMTHVGQTEWNRFAKLVDRPDWSDAFFLDSSKLQEDTKAVTARLRDWAKSRTRADVSQVATEAGFTVTGIFTPLEALSDVQLLHRDFFSVAEGPRRFSIVSSLPFRLSAEDIGPDCARTGSRPSPRKGEHTNTICREHGIEDDVMTIMHQHEVIASS